MYIITKYHTQMIGDIRQYDFHDEEPLKTRMTQAKEYFDEKFSNIKAKVDTTEISEIISDSTSEIKETIIDNKPCLCNLATKADVCSAKCAIIKTVNEDKDLIIKEIDEKFVDLNEQIRENGGK